MRGHVRRSDGLGDGGLAPGVGPEYTARLVCTWGTWYQPTEVDAASVGALADYATAVWGNEPPAD